MPHLKAKSSTSFEDAFFYTVSQIAKLAAEVGIRIRPYYSSSLPYFNQLSVAKKIAVLSAANSYLSVCEQTKMSSNLADSRTFVWTGIKSLGLRPSSDLFSRLQGEDIVEIHDFSARQLFRNLNYFKYSSYDLESLFCLDIHHLFSYEERTLGHLMQWFKEVASGRWDNIKAFNIQPTKIVELQSPLKFELKVDFLFGGPLFGSDGKPAATVSLERARIEKSAAASIEEEEGLLNSYYKAPPNFDLV